MVAEGGGGNGMVEIDGGYDGRWWGQEVEEDVGRGESGGVLDESGEKELVEEIMNERCY